MKKIHSVGLIVIVLIVGFFSFKIMSLLGCYVRIEDLSKCLKLIAW